MRVALISLAGDWPAIAGKPLVERQAEFALAAGAERILAVGDGASGTAIALRHAVERAEARFQAIRDCRELLGATRTDDDLLVLAPGLLPDCGAAIGLLARASSVLILPANAGAAAGFERIDLQRAWGGALVVSGAQVERLAGLPAETEPAAALLRVALQAGAREQALPEAWVADGSWTMLREAADGEALSREWLRRHVPSAAPFSPSDRLGQRIVRAAGVPLLQARGAVTGAQAGAWLGLALGAGLAWIGHPALGLGVLALTVVLSVVGRNLSQLQEVSKQNSKTSIDRSALAGWMIDAALVAAGAGAIDGSWPHRLFPPLVLAGALRAGRVSDATSPAALLGDRALLAVLLAVAAVFGQVEPATMLLALLAIGLDLPKAGPSRG